MAKPKAAKRPSRDEFVLEEIANQLSEVKQEDSILELTVWGMEEPLRGRIVAMDPRTGKVHVEDNQGFIAKVPFMDIMKVNYARI